MTGIVEVTSAQYATTKLHFAIDSHGDARHVLKYASDWLLFSHCHPQLQQAWLQELCCRSDLQLKAAPCWILLGVLVPDFI